MAECPFSPLPNSPRTRYNGAQEKKEWGKRTDRGKVRTRKNRSLARCGREWALKGCPYTSATEQRARKTLSLRFHAYKEFPYGNITDQKCFDIELHHVIVCGYMEKEYFIKTIETYLFLLYLFSFVISNNTHIRYIIIRLHKNSNHNPPRFFRWFT